MLRRYAKGTRVAKEEGVAIGEKRSVVSVVWVAKEVDVMGFRPNQHGPRG